MFYHNLNPVLFQFFGLEIRYYGLFYLIGFVIAYFLMRFLAKERKININKEDILDYLLYILVGGIIGARLGYVISHITMYLNNPIHVLFLWQGGLAFHGGLIGAIFTAMLFCKKRKISFYKLADITVIPFSIGIALVRLANFINGELYGRVTSLPWGVMFKDAEGFRHPYQIYASIKGMLIFVTLFLIRNNKNKDGFLFWFFIMMYGGSRFLVEFFREPVYLFMGISFTQVLSMIMLLIGLYFVFQKRRNERKH